MRRKIIDQSKQRVDNAISKRLDEELTSEKVREEIKARITEEVLRRHVEAVLMMDANGQIVTDYVEKRAEKLDRNSVTQLIHLINEAIKSLPHDVPEECGGKEAGWLARLRTLFTK